MDIEEDFTHLRPRFTDNVQHDFEDAYDARWTEVLMYKDGFAALEGGVI